MKTTNYVIPYVELDRYPNNELGPILGLRKKLSKYLDYSDGFVLSSRAFHLFKADKDRCSDFLDQVTDAYSNLPINESWVRLSVHKYQYTKPETMISKSIRFAKGDTSLQKALLDLYEENIPYDGELVVDLQSIEHFKYHGVTFWDNSCNVFGVPGLWGVEWSSSNWIRIDQGIEPVSLSEVPIYSSWGHGVKETGSGSLNLTEADLKKLFELTTHLNQNFPQKVIIEWALVKDVLKIINIYPSNITVISEIKDTASKKKFKLLKQGVCLSGGTITGNLTFNFENCNGQILIINKVVPPCTLGNINCSGFVCLNSINSNDIGIIARLKKIPAIEIDLIDGIIEGQKVVLNADAGSLILPQEEDLNLLTVKRTKTEVLSNQFLWSKIDEKFDGYFYDLNLISRYIRGNNSFQQLRLSQIVDQLLNNNSYNNYFFEINNKIIADYFSGVNEDSLINLSVSVWISHKNNSNLNLVFSGLSNNYELKMLKKTLYYNQIKRTGNFRFYLKIQTASLNDNLLSCINEGIDGVIIDADNLSKSWIGSSVQQNSLENITEYLIKTVDLCYQRVVPCYIQGLSIVFNPELVQKLIKAHASGFISEASYLPILKTDINRNELNISKNKHRENKKNKI